MPVLVDSTIEAWLREDIGHHDVTNDVPGQTEGRLVTRETGIVAGLDVATRVFEYLGVDAETTVESGTRIESDETVLRVAGPARDVLRGERVAVNVAGHASGIASRTHEAVAAAREVDVDVNIAATRKTTPGLRGIEKRAVVAGGGDTHRLDLSHMAMVKDNHVAELGVERAVERVREQVSFTTKIEVEIEQPSDATRAADSGADIVLFDNMTPEEVSDGVSQLPAETLAEASGGIGLADVPAYAATGVDIISMGSLTHSAPVLDFSFRTE